MEGHCRSNCHGSRNVPLTFLPPYSLKRSTRIRLRTRRGRFVPRSFSLNFHPSPFTACPCRSLRGPPFKVALLLIREHRLL